MGNYLRNHPEIKEVFCRECRTLKPSAQMRTRFTCNDCYDFKYRQKLRAFLESRAQLPQPQPEPKPQPQPEPEAELTRKLTRPRRIWTKEKKAEICEQHIGLGMGMTKLAKKHYTTLNIVSRIIAEYYGFGLPPVTMHIDLTDDIDGKP